MLLNSRASASKPQWRSDALRIATATTSYCKIRKRATTYDFPASSRTQLSRGNKGGEIKTKKGNESNK